MKQILLFLFIIPSIVYCQNYDVRSLNWGMTINEVKSSEKPLIPFSEKSDELRYNDVDLNGTMSSSIIYTFSNGKLIEARYIVYGPKDVYSRGTCNKKISLSQKMMYTSFIYNALIEKDMKQFLGWKVTGTKVLENPKLKNGGYDSEIINILEEDVKKYNGLEVSLSLSNERTYVNLSIKTSTTNHSSFFDCDDNYYNTYLWLVFTPSSQVLSEIRKRTF